MEALEQIASDSQRGHGLLDGGDQDRIDRGQRVAPAGQQLYDCSCRWWFGWQCAAACASSPRCPFRDDAQHTDKARGPDAPPEFRAVAAAAFPFRVQTRQKRIERTHPGAEHFRPAATDDGTHEFAAAPGATHDLLDRGSCLGKPTYDGAVGFTAPEPIVLALLGGGQPAGIDGGNAKGRADARHRAVHGVKECGGDVLEQVPAISYLLGSGADTLRRRSVGTATIARDHLDARMRRQPVFDGAGGTVGQQVDDAPTLQVADDGPIPVTTPPRPVVNSDDAERLGGACGCAAAHQSEQRRAARRQSETLRQPRTGGTAERETMWRWMSANRKGVCMRRGDVRRRRSAVTATR